MTQQTNMPNFPLLDSAIEALEMNPDHDQSVWLAWDGGGPPPQNSKDQTPIPPCGTKLCLAGQIAWMTGAEISWYTGWDGWRASAVNDHQMTIPQYARLQLGLGVKESEALFHEAEDLDDIKAIRDRLKTECGYTN